MKNLMIIATLVVSYSVSGLAETPFAKQHCNGDCNKRLLVDFDPNQPLTVDEHFLIQEYTQSYNVLDQDMFLEAIRKLPASQTIVYRGTETSKSGIKCVGQILTLDRFVSTSTNRFIAENFVRNQILVINSKSARSIIDYSGSGEEEHIILPGAKLRVDKITHEKLEIVNQIEEKVIDVQVVYMTEL